MTDSIPIIINPDTLFQLNRDPEILLVDVRSREEYDAGHLPDAVLLDYAHLIEAQPPALGLPLVKKNSQHCFHGWGCQIGSMSLPMIRMQVQRPVDYCGRWI